MDTIKTLNPLLDLDPTVYAAGFAADAEVRRDLMAKGMTKEEADEARQEIDYLGHALGNAKTHVEHVLHEAFPEHQWYRAFITGKNNFRDKVATILPYKGNRDPTHKPKYYKDLREYLVDKYKTEVVEGQEADDMLGIIQWDNPDKSTVICSIDKDLKMIPGYHFNPGKGMFWYQSMDEADAFFWWQMLVGDTTDNIPGIYNIGPRKADKALADGNHRKVVEEMYQKQYGSKWKEAFDEVASLLWIRREEGVGPNV
jgi:hypothetical protein